MTPSAAATPRRVVLFCGRGGTGKTTVACAVAIEVAERHPEMAFRLLSIDPAHSLSDVLGDVATPPNLAVEELDGHAALAAFLELHAAELHQILGKGTFLDGADVDSLLDAGLPGLDEAGAVLRLADLLRDGEHVLVDTAPWGHARRFLDSPALIEGWAEALEQLSAKDRFLGERLSRARVHAARPVVSGILRAATRLVKDVLSDSEACRVVPVCTPAQRVLAETAQLVEDLDARGLRATEVVLNRFRAESSSCAVCRELARAERELVEAATAAFRGQRTVFVRLGAEEARGQRLRHLFLDDGDAGFDASSNPSPAEDTVAPAGRVPAPGPSPETRLVIFVGKGGVGKTTLAAAFGAALSQRGVLTALVSADPAHSLGGLVMRPLDGTPREIAPALVAAEFDGALELERLRQVVRDDMVPAHADGVRVAFEVESVEALLSLSPPGLDEVMALVSLAEISSRDERRCVVLDTPATGHLIRLLEAPRLVADWLKLSFELLLKYKHVLRLPRTADGLLSISRRLRAFRRRLLDARETCLYVVTLPSEVARLETGDLFGALGRLGLAPKALLVNQVEEPRGSCRTCRSAARRDAQLSSAYASDHPGTPITVVPRVQVPRGVPGLASLGESVFDLGNAA